MKLANEQLQYFENEVKIAKASLDELDREKELLSRNLMDVRLHGKSEMEALELEVAAKRDENSKLNMTVSQNDTQLRKLKRDTADLTLLLGKEREELKALEKLKSGNAVEEDSVLREKAEVMKKIELVRAKDVACVDVLRSVQAELAVGQDQFQTMRSTIKELESKVFALSDQYAQSLVDKKTNIETAEKRVREIASLESKRNEIVTEIEVKEAELTNSIEKELKEISRTNNALATKVKALEADLSVKVAGLESVEPEIEQKRLQLVSYTTQNEFMRHQIESSMDWIAKGKSDLNRIVRKMDELKASPVAEQLQAVQNENGRLQVESDKLRADIEFMTTHGMVGPDGVVKPLLIESTDGGSGLVEKLRINEFLVQAQSEPEVARVNLLLIEKISQLLEMIYRAEQLEIQYEGDRERGRVMTEQLQEKNKSLSDSIFHLREYAGSALLQFGLNLARAGGDGEGGRIKMLLTGMGYTDNDLEELMTTLTQEDEARIEKIDVANNKLTNFNLNRLIVECPMLRDLDVRGNEIESLNELERFLRTKVDGITSVFRDTKVIIANSGAQVRLVVHHGDYDS